MYRVKEFFTDLTDNNHAYHAGDKFPRNGLSVSKARIEELSGTHNKRGISLIEFIPDPQTEPEMPRRGRPRKRGIAL